MSLDRKSVDECGNIIVLPPIVTGSCETVALGSPGQTQNKLIRHKRISNGQVSLVKQQDSDSFIDHAQLDLDVHFNSDLRGLHSHTYENHATQRPAISETSMLESRGSSMNRSHSDFKNSVSKHDISNIIAVTHKLRPPKNLIIAQQNTSVEEVSDEN